MMRLTLQYPSCYRGRVGCGATVHGVKGFQGVNGVEAKSSASLFKQCPELGYGRRCDGASKDAG